MSSTSIAVEALKSYCDLCPTCAECIFENLPCEFRDNKRKSVLDTNSTTTTQKGNTTDD